MHRAQTALRKIHTVLAAGHRGRADAPGLGDALLTLRIELDVGAPQAAPKTLHRDLVRLAGDPRVHQSADAEGVHVGDIALLGNFDSIQSLQTAGRPALNDGLVAVAGNFNAVEFLERAEGAQLQSRLVLRLTRDRIGERERRLDADLVALLSDTGATPGAQLSLDLQLAKILRNDRLMQKPVGHQTYVQAGVEVEPIAQIDADRLKVIFDRLAVGVTVRIRSGLDVGLTNNVYLAHRIGNDFKAQRLLSVLCGRLHGQLSAQLFGAQALTAAGQQHAGHRQSTQCQRTHPTLGRAFVLSGDLDLIAGKHRNTGFLGGSGRARGGLLTKRGKLADLHDFKIGSKAQKVLNLSLTGCSCAQEELSRNVDPIYYQVNQTRLTEVTQKSSDNLRLQGNKEAKRKAEKAGDVDKSALSSDSSSMSDDMLGDMDPDDYGGRGAEQFAQMWKNQLEDEENVDEEPPEEGDEEPPEPEDEISSTKEESETEGLTDEEQAEVEGTRLTPPATTPSVAVAQDAAEARDPAAGERPPAVAPPPVTPPTLAPKLQVQEAPAQKLQTAAPSASASETVLIAAPGAKSSLGSLLDFSSGFLIAEEAQWDPNAAEEAVLKEEPLAEEVLPEEISFLLERLVVGDATQPGFRKLNSLLSRFGRRVLQQCIEAHAKVYLLPPGEPLLTHPELANCGHTDLQGAAYLPQARICLVEDDCVSQAPHGFHPVFYYFAHLWDHAMGGESFASSKSAAVQASYQVCLDGGHRFGDLMSSNSPAHYFAQAVESYLAENDCFEPLWTRSDLHDFDRSIYDYIEYLLK